VLSQERITITALHCLVGLLQLRQVEKEAKHDVKDRAGRRYHRLEQSVVWLLVVSCMLAALEVGKKAVSKQNAASSSSSSGLASSRGLLSSVAVQVDDGADSGSYELADSAGVQSDAADSAADDADAVAVLAVEGADAVVAVGSNKGWSAEQERTDAEQQQQDEAAAEDVESDADSIDTVEEGGFANASSSSSRPKRSWWRVWQRESGR
jgi:hypothetical protein